MLAYLRKGETFDELAAGFGIGRTTAWRYVNETIELLAARAPKLRQAVRDAKRAGHAYVILDGTLIPIDRVARDKPFYSGKHKKHGMNLQVIASPDGDILWVSGALPGSVHDKKAEWIWGVLDELEKAGPGHPRRQGLPGQHLGEGPVQGQEQARTAERGQPRPRETPRPRRAGERAAQDMEDPHQAPLLPVARRETRQGHSRIAAPRGITRLETAHYGYLATREDLPSYPEYQLIHALDLLATIDATLARARDLAVARDLALDLDLVLSRARAIASTSSAPAPSISPAISTPTSSSFSPATATSTSTPPSPATSTSPPPSTSPAPATWLSLACFGRTACPGRSPGAGIGLLEAWAARPAPHRERSSRAARLRGRAPSLLRISPAAG